MKNVLLLSLFLFLVFCPVLLCLNNQLQLKKIPHSIENPKQKIHPYQDYFFSLQNRYQPSVRSQNFNRLLVLLVEFQEDDNPQSTGNGKFQTTIDLNYPISIGAPPHDREYYEKNFEAVYYYYQAVSYGEFNLDFEIYPKTKQAFELPQNMAFYHPKEQNLFVERTMQYMRDIFSVADNDPDETIDFQTYEHFLVIHAGSSWQHDVYNNSPHDLPSYFIAFGDDVEPIITNSGYKIRGVANVPETITQDTGKRNSGSNVIYGYGATNSVYVHEFGHSLGFVDLYNTQLGYPAVGMFDIMDSGGGGILADFDEAGNEYHLEGILPSLPGVWTRLLAGRASTSANDIGLWEQLFLDNKMLIDLNTIELQATLPILASSTARKNNELDIPYFYRLKLSEEEYLLIENRNVNPSGDGGTRLEGALQNRVILYPSSFGSDGPNYEYDYILPCFISQEGVIGGGLLIWQINNNIIYNQKTLNNGEWYSNFELNQVNLLNRLGVKIIEADNIVDLGNPYSYFWTGTEYDYYYQFQADLNSEGSFIGWTNKFHNTELSSQSKPALITNQGKPSAWKIANISGPGRIMNFQISNSLFDYTTHIGQFTGLKHITTSTRFYGTLQEQIGILGEEGLFFYQQKNSDSPYDFIGQEHIIPLNPDFEIVRTQIRSDEQEELLFVQENKLILLVDGYSPFEYILENSITQTPLYFRFNQDSFLAISFTNSLAIFQLFFENNQVLFTQKTSFAHPGKLLFDEQTLYLQAATSFYYLTNDLTFVKIIELPGMFTQFDPVLYRDFDRKIFYFMSDQFDLYTFQNQNLAMIFSLRKFTLETPSQLALGYTPQLASNFILFHTTTLIYLLTEEGAFLPGFPRRLTDYHLDPDSYPIIMRISKSFDNPISNQEGIVFMLTDQAQGFLAMDFSAKVRSEYSRYWNKGPVPPRFILQEEDKSLKMIYADQENNVFSGTLHLDQTDAIIWNGYRNNAQGVLVRDIHTTPQPDKQKIAIFVYPNPTKQEIVNIKILNTNSEAKISIYNLSGQIILTEKIPRSLEKLRDFRFSSDKLTSGVYFVCVEVENKILRKKFAIIK